MIHYGFIIVFQLVLQKEIPQKPYEKHADVSFAHLLEGGDSQLLKTLWHLNPLLFE